MTAEICCDVCGYVDTSALKMVVQKGPDGVMRCKICRHRLMYGRYIHGESEAFALTEEDFTDEYKRILEESD